MRPIPFRANPASATIGDGLELSVAHLRANVAIWLVPTAIYTLVSGAVTWAVLSAFADRVAQYRYDPGSLESIRQAFFDNLPGLVGFVIMLVIGGLALYWIAMALALGGLPGRRMTPDLAVSAGLRSIALGVLFFLAVIPIMFALVAVGLLAGDAALWLLLLFIPAVMVGFAYVGIRLVFSLFAIFDGVGLFDSIRLSWSISRGGMLRTLGWLLALGAISFGISIVGGIASPAFAAFPFISTILGTLLTTVFQFFQAVVLAILYESQRMRHVYATPGGAVLPGGPVNPAPPSVEPAAPADPQLPPPPPAL